jgi:organic radical activating enzyme
MYELNYCEFYITNVCNLNCPNCNRFNNYAFTGHYKWNDHCEDYKKWSKLLNVKNIGILGGEPFLNPEILKWVEGIAQLWPHSKIIIITNGTQLQRYPELYSELMKYQGRVVLEINGHSKFEKPQVLEEIKNLLVSPKETLFDNSPTSWTTMYSNIRDASWPECDRVEDFYQLPEYIQQECRALHNVNPESWIDENYDRIFVDKNNIKIHYRPAWSFNESAVKFDPYRETLSLYQSDPDKAMKACYFKICHHFIDGKLYKCGPTGILPEFIKQFPVKLTDNQRSLINSYKPAEAEWTDNELSLFIDNLKTAKSIDQCSLCPETFTPQEFTAGTKKIKIVKI